MKRNENFQPARLEVDENILDQNLHFVSSKEVCVCAYGLCVTLLPKLKSKKSFYFELLDIKILFL